MTTRTALMSPIGNVHRVLVQKDGADGTGCGMELPKGKHVAVSPVQALVYHLHGCQSPGCWGSGMWVRWMEGNLT